MDPLSQAGFILGSSASAGLNLYLTVLALGITNYLGYYDLPEKLHFISNPFIIALVFLMAIVEFFADKVPYLDNAWDFVHTFLRPLGAAIIGYSLAPGDLPEPVMAALSGGVAFTTHAAKSGTRVMANATPEPFSNSILSFTEDGIVLGMVYLIIYHPFIALIAGLVLVVAAIALIYFAYKTIGSLFNWLLGRRPAKEVIPVRVKRNA